MQTIIGLGENKAAAELAADALKEAGFASSSIDVHRHQRSLWESLGCTPRGIIRHDLLISVLLGGLLFGYFGVIAAEGEVLMGQSDPIAGAALIGFILVGAICGAIMGLFIGFGDMENRLRFYMRSMRQGGVVLVVHTADEHAARAQGVLRQAGLQRVQRHTAATQEHGLRPAPAVDRMAVWSRWLARASGALLAVVILVYVAGALSNPLGLAVSEDLLLATLLTTLAGIVLAWRREGIGGALILASALLYATINALASEPWRLGGFTLWCAITGALLLWTWWYTHQHGTPQQSLPNL